LRARVEEAPGIETYARDYMLVRCLAASGWSADLAFPLVESYLNILEPAVNLETLVCRDVLAEVRANGIFI
jgi:hypothetical protein